GFKLETSADLNIAMSGPKTITSGSNITYAITTGNTGPDGASVVSITDSVPAGLTYVSSTISPTGSCSLVIVLGHPSVVTCTAGYQALGTKLRASVVFKVTATSGTISNIAAVASANSTNAPQVTVDTTVN
ncbi:MAG TPA: hypothetical protein VND65_23060, partial [Candidatus Binatia bacterium]|nr:hypothetical protein [Candidatus Binatia bacterium]